MKNYQSPEIEFQDMQLKEDIANVCWGGHSYARTWYYDTEGTGYVSFQISGGSCDLNLANVMFYENNNATPVPVTQGTEKYDELYQAALKSQGNSGQSFKGEKEGFPIDKPDQGWS